MIQVTFPFSQFTDKAGLPLDAGFIYIGTENINPETNPIALFWDDALTIPAAQPLRTINGYISRNGSPGRVYTNTSAYSITVRDKSSNLVATALDASALDNLRADLAAPSGSSLMGHTPSGSGSVPTTVEQQLNNIQGWIVNVKDAPFYAIGGGADDTEALQKAIDSGLPLDFGSDTYSHSGLSVTTEGNVHWMGKGASLVYTGSSEIDAVVVQASSGVNAENCFISGINFDGGKSGLRVAGQENSIFKNVVVEKCKALNTALSTFWFYHIDGLSVTGNRAENAGDVGIYAEFSRNVFVNGNFVRNCQGSAGIVVAYGDTVIDYGATDELSSNVIISNNIVVADDDAVSGNYIGGIQINMISGAEVFGNVVRNAQTAIATDKSIRVGIVISEWVLKDVNIHGNTIINMFQYGMRCGADATTKIRRLRVSGNRISKVGLSGLYFERVMEGLEIVDNTIEFTQQHGIYLETTCYDALVSNNSFRHVGIQPTFAAVSGVECLGRNYRVYDNRFYCGADALVVTSTQTSPEFSVDVTNKIITLYSSGSVQASTSYSGATFEEIRAWISSQTGFTSYFEHAELGAIDATHILRRTGPRSTAAVNNVAISGFTAITSAEPQYLVNAVGNEGDVRGNKWTSYAVNYADSFDGARKMFSFGGDVLTDVNSYGARTFMYDDIGSRIGRWYVPGDKVINGSPVAGQPKSWVCTTAGNPGTFTSEGNL